MAIPFTPPPPVYPDFGGLAQGIEQAGAGIGTGLLQRAKLYQEFLKQKREQDYQNQMLGLAQQKETTDFQTTNATPLTPQVYQTTNQQITANGSGAPMRPDIISEVQRIHKANSDIQEAKAKSTVYNPETGEISNMGPGSHVLPPKSKGAQKYDPERMLTVEENKQFGTPQGTTFKDVQGKVPASPAVREKLNDFTAAYKMIDNLSGQADAMGLASGPMTAIPVGIANKAASMLPFTDSGIYKSQTKNLSLLIRAMGEKGALAEGDVSRAQEAIPGAFDTDESKMKKLNILRSLLDAKKEGLMANLQGDILGGQGGATPKSKSLSFVIPPGAVSQTNQKTGKRRYSVDGKKTWVSEP